jgi:hypothetical protein
MALWAKRFLGVYVWSRRAGVPHRLTWCDADAGGADAGDGSSLISSPEPNIAFVLPRSGQRDLVGEYGLKEVWKPSTLQGRIR